MRGKRSYVSLLNQNDSKYKNGLVCYEDDHAK